MEMRKFKVVVGFSETRTFSKQVEIEAVDEDQAEDLANQKVLEDELEFDIEPDSVEFNESWAEVQEEIDVEAENARDNKRISD